MHSPPKRHFTPGSIVLAVLLSASTQAASPGPPAHVTQLFTQRNANLRIFECRLRTTHVVPGDAFISEVSGEPAFDEDPVVYVSTRELTVDTATGKFRIKQAMPSFAPERGRMETIESVTVFNGEAACRYHETGTISRSGKRRADLTWIDPDSLVVTSFSYDPIFWHLGFLSPESLHNQQSFDLASQATEWTTTAEGVTAIVPAGVVTLVFHFDNSIGGNISQVESHATSNVERGDFNAASSTYTLQYESVDGDWELAEYRFSHRTMGDKVTEVEQLVSATPSAADFELPKDFLKPGMLIVGDGGASQMASNVSTVPPTPDAPTRSKRYHWIPAAIAVLAILVVSLYAVYVRIQKRRRD